MAQVGYRECLKDCKIITKDGVCLDEFKKGERVLCLPGLDKDGKYCVGTDFHVPGYLDKEYLSEELFDSWK